MIFNIIPIIIIFISLVAIIFIIGKKLPQLRVMDVETITEVKESQAKRRIIEQRLARKSTLFKRKLLALCKPLAKATANIFKKIYQQINAWEKEYQQATVSRRSRIKDLLTEGDKNLAEQNFEKAEFAFIGVIELDPKNLEAYQGLSELYLLKKDYQKARQSLEHVLKLLRAKKVGVKPENGEHQVSECLTRIGLIHQQTGQLEAALDCFKKAVEQEPNNPKYLDLLLKILIMLRDKDTAQETLMALKKADPGNKKFEELKKQVEEIR